MPQNFASNGKLSVILPGPRGANQQLLTCESVDIKADGKVDVVVTIGVPGGAGWQETQGGFKIDLKMIRLTSADPEIDWDYAKATKKIGTFTTADEDGGRREAYTFRVSKTDTSMSNDGKFIDSVELAAILKVTNS
jgi:hypothetical protein